MFSNTTMPAQETFRYSLDEPTSPVGSQLAFNFALHDEIFYDAEEPFDVPQSGNHSVSMNVFPVLPEWHEEGLYSFVGTENRYSRNKRFSHLRQHGVTDQRFWLDVR